MNAEQINLYYFLLKKQLSLPCHQGFPLPHMTGHNSWVSRWAHGSLSSPASHFFGHSSGSYRHFNHSFKSTWKHLHVSNTIRDTELSASTFYFQLYTLLANMIVVIRHEVHRAWVAGELLFNTCLHYITADLLSYLSEEDIIPKYRYKKVGST